MYKKITEAQKAQLKLAQIKIDSAKHVIVLVGEWNWVSINENILQTAKKVHSAEWQIDGKQIQDVDTTGIYFLHKFLQYLSERKVKVAKIDLLPDDKELFEMTTGMILTKSSQMNEVNRPGFVERMYERLMELWQTCVQLLAFFGHLCYTAATLVKKDSSLYVQGIFDTVSRAGIHGITICSALAFLLGVNLIYQMAPQFVTYGANVYAVNFLGIAMLREVTPLVTAIIVAGRTGSSIAASIGTMKAQEEIDALQTMGISPMRRLVLPQVIGLVFALPILTTVADMASMFGGMIFAKPLLGVDYSLFLSRLQAYVSINNFWVGIVKSFFFAWIIGMVGCFCGFRVKANAESIGIQTTKSVVISICLIVIVDALFAVIFKIMGV